MSPEPEGHEGEYGLVMPFVTVASAGGPHDDAAFTAGWECGRADQTLTALAGHLGRLVVGCNPDVIPQLDLIAMRHGYRIEVTPWGEHPEEWCEVVITNEPEEGTHER